MEIAASHIFTFSIQNFTLKSFYLSLDAHSDINAVDVDTPRGVTAKEEVKRLRTVMMHKTQDVFSLLAAAKFRELDLDNSNFLEHSELTAVVAWVMAAVGNRLGTDTEEVKKRIMDRLVSSIFFIFIFKKKGKELIVVFHFMTPYGRMQIKTAS